MAASKEMATMGFSKIAPFVISGRKQSDLMGTLMVENDILKLNEKLIPLQTSFTQSPTEQGKSGGAPTKEEGQQADKTIQNKNSGATTTEK